MFSPMAMIRRVKEAREAQARELALNPEDSSSGKSFKRLYKVGDRLGRGAFSVVNEATHKQSGKSFAIKTVNKYHLAKEDADALMDEISILRELDHPHIVTLYDVFDGPDDYIYLVTEKIPGGDLHQRISKKGQYQEDQARIAVKILFDALAYTHKHNVVHRDLKLENLLLMSKKDDTQVKIIDYGFAKRVTSPNGLKTFIGTPAYCAPCILEGVGYGTQADNWSMGVVVFCMLGGYPPFRDANRDKLFRKIRKGQYEFHDKKWGKVTPLAKEFIRRLLTIDPKQRSTAAQALEHPWMHVEEQDSEEDPMNCDSEALSDSSSLPDNEDGLPEHEEHSLR